MNPNLAETDKQIIIFKTEDDKITVDVRFGEETAWLTLDQMAMLFERDKSTISRHIKNVFEEGELERNSVVANFATTAADGKMYQVDYHNLDVIISVGYRVKSLRGTQFRQWATKRLKDYILKGYAVNRQRLQDLGQAVRILKRAANLLDGAQVLSVLERYAPALDLLDDYDHQRIGKPQGTRRATKLTYTESRTFIDTMRFGNDSALFGVEKDNSLESSIGAIYQTFGGKPLYPTIEEKAANLLYFIVKNHPFVDGNKRIGAALFLHFLDKNKELLTLTGEKRMSDHTLVALTLMIAESKPAERETMTALVMIFLVEKENDTLLAEAPDTPDFPDTSKMNNCNQLKI